MKHLEGEDRGAERETWMLSTMSSTSPGLPAKRVTSLAKRPTAPRIAKPITPLHSVGQSTCCRRCSTNRSKGPTIARGETDERDETDDPRFHAQEDPVEHLEIRRRRTTSAADHETTRGE
jgi:hypothetical protein